MSEHRELVVALDVASAEQQALADAVTVWLRSAGWARPDPAAAALDFPSGEPDLLAGRADEFVMDRPGRARDTLVGTVSCGVGAPMWDAVDSMEGPSCWSCRTTVADDDVSRLGDWIDGLESVYTCAGCGAVSLAGDMDVSASLVFGNPGVVLITPDHDGPALAVQLIDELRLAFPIRWAYVHQRR